MKKNISVSEPIALRTKALAGGRLSLYLDYYDYSGNKSRSHSYEFLKLYLLPETTKENKQKNKLTLQTAKAIQAQRLIERANGMAHIKSNKSNMLLSDYMDHYAKIKRSFGQSDSRALIVEATTKKLKEYKPNITMSHVDKAFCIGFIAFLKDSENSKATKTHKLISNGTIKQYFSTLLGALSQAVKEDVIPSNPADKITKEERKVYTYDDNTRTYLTTEEVCKLAQTPCHIKEVKDAFLFACFCGLRISDINSLMWSEIHSNEDGTMFIRKEIKKTRKEIILPISTNAISFLPERSEGKVFHLAIRKNVNAVLKRWVKSAGIEKKVSFHVSRHTFATALLTQGADLYTTSKLLGHSQIKTTQIYAEIVNKKKQEAVNLLDTIKL